MIIAPPSNHAPPAVKHNGFTLIEMAIVTIIAGILLVGAVQVYDRWVEQKKIDETHDKVAVINDAIQSYIQINSTLPCPARLNALPDDAGGTYGVQTDCTAPPPSGVTEASGRDGEPVRIGALPTRSLNLPDEYAFDGWDNRFTFAVSAHMAETPVLYRTGKGAIFMLDSSGSASTNTGYSLTTPEGTAMYVIVSHGPDGQGAYARAATAPSTLCIPASGADQQSENCDNDAYFKDTTLTSNAGNTQRFDDIVFYQMKDYTNLTAINRFIVDTFPCTVAAPAPICSEKIVPLPGQEAAMYIYPPVRTHRTAFYSTETRSHQKPTGELLFEQR
ncbi:MAG: type II secretion system GspH family protein [Alphaproteobacteria bacterium]|nr:type II secretion system GspH family protein [Alphaproteobacteria bacterium]